MIEMNQMMSPHSPLLRKRKQATSIDATYAGIAVLAVIALAIIALARGKASIMSLSMQMKFAQKPMCSDLTKLKYGKKAHADCINNLPGITFQPGFHSFSGYLKVGPDKEIFYWFVEAQSEPAKKPLVFWMNGGPGCSGLDGLFTEHGPYIVFSDMSLRANPFALNKLANVVYYEAPVGVGFSAPAAGQDVVVGDIETAVDNAEMIREFLRQYPKFANHEVTISSESYGGHYCPTTAAEILTGLDDPKIKTKVNFKGMIVGNPFVDFWGNMRGSMHAYIGKGLVELPLADEWEKNCNKDANLVDVKACFKLNNVIQKKVGHLDPYALDFTFCPIDSLENGNRKWTPAEESKRRKSYMMRQSIKKILKVEQDSNYVACADNYMSQYLNRADVRTAIHAKNVKWALCSDPVHKKWPLKSWEFPMQVLYKKLAETGRIKMMVYSGDDDSVCSTYGTQLWMWKMGFPVSKELDWKAWYIKDQLAGYQTRFLSKDGKRTAMDFTTVHTAGHMVPQTQPQRAFRVYAGFLHSNPEKGFRLGDKYV